MRTRWPRSLVKSGATGTGLTPSSTPQRNSVRWATSGNSTHSGSSARSFFVARAFTQLWLNAPVPSSSRRGKIVLFAGGGGGYGYPQFLPYGTSKAADVRMCETMAMELDAAKLPIDINIVAPGANDTA